MPIAKLITITIPQPMLRRTIAALRYYAHMEAGQTQQPYLCKPPDYQEWDDAEAIEQALKDWIAVTGGVKV